MILNRVKRAFFLFIKSFLIAVAYTFGITVVIVLLLIVIGFLSNTMSYKGESYAFKVGSILKKRQQSWSIVSADDIYFGGEVPTLNQIAVLDMSGVIMPTCYNINDICPARVKTFLDFVEASSNVYGLIILLNSPGGEVYASEDIYQAIKRVASHKPVYVYAESEVASGAYYISMGATKLFASPVSILGSIGVYWEVYNYNGLLEKLGIKHAYLVSSNAKYKVETQWIFNNTKEGKYVKKQLLDIVNETEKIFYKRVKQARPSAKIAELKGLVVSANKAYKLGLIDGVVDNINTLYIDMVKSLSPGAKGLPKEIYVVNYSLSYPITATSTFKHTIKRLTSMPLGSQLYLMYK